MGNYSGLFANCGILYDGTYISTTLKNLINPGTYDSAITGVTRTGVDKYGRSSYGMVFSSASTYIVPSAPPTITGFALWFKNNNHSSHQHILIGNASGGIVLSTDASGHIIAIGIENSGYSWFYTPTITDETWNFYALVQQSGTKYAYTNGIQLSGSTTKAILAPTYIGRTPSGADWLSGIVGLLLFFTGDVSSEQINAMYNITRYKPIQNPHNLRSWWA